MKKFIKWLKSPSSDFSLFVVLLILANLVASNLFLRFDLTGPKSYSISSASKQLVKTISEPISVKVFFSANLPAPYNSVEQYINDILVEYKREANKNFSYHFYNMDDKESQTLAANYGLQQIQIQEIANNEVGFKHAWMGAAIVYADSIKTLDNLTTSDGFEYKLTTTIAKMISTSDSLSILPKNEKINLKLYISKELSTFGIQGVDNLEKNVESVYNSFNRRNQNRISFEKIAPSSNEVEILKKQYGLQAITWQTKTGEKGSGVLGLILEHGDAFRLLPLNIQRSLFGYVITGLENLEDSLSESLQSLVSKSVVIGYIVGHGELDLNDSQTQFGAGVLNNLVSDMYTLKELNLAETDIPLSINSIIINGPKNVFSDSELYKIDQFIMRGGNVMFFVDPFFENAQYVQYGQAPTYTAIDTGLQKLFNSYGVKTGTDYILDENCYTQNQMGYGKISLYFAPVLQKQNLAKHPITDNLGYLIFLQNGSIDVSEAEKNSDIKVTPLAKTSAKSWLMTENIRLDPTSIYPPSDKTKQKSENLAVLLEGKFKSAFETAPVADAENATDDAPIENGTENTTPTTNAIVQNSPMQNDDSISMHSHLTTSTQNAKIFIAGSSAILSAQLVDDRGSEPISIFDRNVIDFMNGNEDLCYMRTKGLSLNVLDVSNVAAVVTAKYFNQFGLAIIVALIGLFVWNKRTRRRREIHQKYNPNDTRTVHVGSRRDDFTRANQADSKKSEATDEN